MSRAAALLTFAFILSASGQPRRRFNFIINDFQFINKSTIFDAWDISHQPVANGVILDYSIRFRRDLNQFTVRILVDIIQKFAKVKWNFIDLSFDGCKALATKFDDALLQSLFVELRRSSNHPLICPFKAGILYKWEKFTVTTSMLPAYTPDLNFTFTLEFSDKNELLSKLNILGSIVSKR